MSDSEDWTEKKNRILAEIENFAERDVSAVDEAPMPPPTGAGAPVFDRRESVPVAPAPRPPSATPVAAPLTASVTPNSLLARLKQQAEVKQSGEANKESLQEQQRRQISSALGDAYGYLRDLVEQVNVLKPESPGYYLNEQVSFDGLTWREGRADLRKLEGATDDRLIKTVSLRYVLAGKAPIVVEKEAPGMGLLKQTLDDYGLLYAMQEIKNAKARTERVNFTIQHEVRAGLLFSADYERGDIHLRTLNVQRFGSAEYRIPAATLTHQVVEEIALLVLGESNQFVRRFTRVA